MKIITTSWDDGYKESLEIAHLLKKYALKGTFYVPVNALEGKLVETLNSDEQFISKEELIDISQDFEIGAHGVAHHFLTQVSKDVAREEIEGSKNYLEKILGEEISGFAYPGGKFDEEIVEIVRKAGYSYARITGRGKMNFSNRFKVPVTIFCYNNTVRRIKFSLFAPFSKVYAFGGDWTKSVLKAFRNLKEKGGVLHLAEHPNRLRNPSFRKNIEKIFSRISSHSGINYLTNKEMVEKVLGGR